MAMDEMEMKVKARSGTDTEKRYAAKVLPLISRHHLVLATLMTWNACVNEALPIFLTALVPDYVAIILSTVVVVLLCEILPASVMTGPYQLRIAATLSPIVYLAMAVFFVVAYPISLGLDFFIGSNGLTMYNRMEISAMMQLHVEEGARRRGLSENPVAAGKKRQQYSKTEIYEQEEVDIIAGALKYRELPVSQVMTPAADVYMISVGDTLNYKLVYEIFKSGYSRIPVYDRDRDDVVGLILAKDLIFVDPEVLFLFRNMVLSRAFIGSCVVWYRMRHLCEVSWICSGGRRAWCGTTANSATP
jgi:metal transporter CNNM